MSRAIVFTSGKGGVGKSTLTLTVGRALAEMGKSVALMDTDIGLNNLDVLMNVEHSVIYDIVDVLQGRCRLSQALIADRSCKNLSLLPSSHSYGDGTICGQNLKEIVNRLKNTYDFVLIDCPAGIEFGFHRAVAAADEAVVVSTAHLSALKDAAKVVELIRSYGINALIALNRVRGDMLLGGEALTVDEIDGIMNAKIIGVIPEDDNVNLLSCGFNSSKGGDGRSAIRLLARNICFGLQDLYDVTKKYRGFFGGLKRRLKGRL
ncbi:MAG: septum site-determining protein MinD [Clostridia bacterium]|nr:septum site-determining protein MinD [Clostridia bacterium]